MQIEAEAYVDAVVARFHLMESGDGPGRGAVLRGGELVSRHTIRQLQLVAIALERRDANRDSPRALAAHVVAREFATTDLHFADLEAKADFGAAARALEIACIAALGGTDADARGQLVLALYWLSTLVGDGAGGADGTALEGLRNAAFAGDGDEAVGVAACIELARRTSDPDLGPDVVAMLESVMHRAAMTDGGVFRVLANVKGSIRRAVGGFPTRYDILAGSTAADAPLARFENIGECLRLVEDWRDAVEVVVPAIGERLEDVSSPVVAAAARGAFRCGAAARALADGLDDVAARFAARGNSDPVYLCAMATLVAVGDRRGLPGLPAILGAPHGSVPLERVVASAAQFADTAVHAIRALLRASAGRNTIESERCLAAVLDGLAAWDGLGRFEEEIAELLDAGTAVGALLGVIEQSDDLARYCAPRLRPLIEPSANSPDELVASVACALIRAQDASVDRAGEILVSMLGDPFRRRAALRRAAELGPRLGGIIATSSLQSVARDELESEVEVVRVCAARLAWSSGLDDQRAVKVLTNAIAPGWLGSRVVHWLSEIGGGRPEIWEAFSRYGAARRRPRHDHTSDYPVLADDQILATMKSVNARAG